MSGSQIIHTLKDGIWAVLMPVIILGDIFGGIFTATEAATVSVIYALLTSFFVYKDIKLSEFLPLLIEANAAVVMMTPLLRPLILSLALRRSSSA